MRASPPRWPASADETSGGRLWLVIVFGGWLACRPVTAVPCRLLVGWRKRSSANKNSGSFLRKHNQYYDRAVIVARMNVFQCTIPVCECKATGTCGSLPCAFP
jgi:hypothetical protein